MSVETAAVLVVLTDGEFIHDNRAIAPGDLDWLNRIARQEFGGEMWWQVAEPLPECEDINEAEGVS